MNPIPMPMLLRAPRCILNAPDASMIPSVPS